MGIFQLCLIFVFLINAETVLACFPTGSNKKHSNVAPVSMSAPVPPPPSMATSTRFTASNQTAEKHKFNEWLRVPPELIPQLKRSYAKKLFRIKEILQVTDFSSRNVTFQKNGFVSTVLSAYGGHHNLIIRPDDVWTAIMVQFSYYLNANSEKYRSKFVKHSGKKNLKVILPGSLRAVPYDTFINLMTEKIDENLIDPSIKSWVLPNFTTTTEEDKVAVGVVFMASLKHYFSYEFGITCGIPQVTIEGSLNDWLEIRHRLQRLKEYDLEWWLEKLDWILENFINAKQGNVDRQFWEDVVQKQPLSCGMDNISGWLTAFAVFDQEGQKYCDDGPRYAFDPYDDSCEHGSEVKDNTDRRHWFICDLLKLPNGMVMVDVKITEGEMEYNGVLFGGHMGTEVIDDG